MSLTRHSIWALALLLGALLHADPSPVFEESFDTGKEDGPVGKAGLRFDVDARGLVDLERGTIAFFYQSKEAPKETEWGGMGGIRAQRDGGYWTMGPSWQTRRQEFMFNFYDVGFYAPPLKCPTIFGRWQAGQWHHLAVVWDRYEGITIYEDGKRVNSNWGRYRWNWNLSVDRFWLAGPLDEVRVYGQCLTDAQIAQLAKGEAATGEPLEPVPLDDPARRQHELERMGWDEPNLPAIPTVAPGAGVAFRFVRVARAVDAKRPVAYPYEGILDSTWPSHKYGASIRGQRLELTLEAGASFDRVRLFVHRPFSGTLVREVNHERQELLGIEAPRAAFWHRQLAEPVAAESLVLERDWGQMGQIDFFRVEPLAAAAGTWRAYSLAPAAAFPDTEQGRTLAAQTPRRSWKPVTATLAVTPAASLATPAFGGFQAICEEPADARAYDAVRVRLTVEGVTAPTPVRVEIKEPVYHRRIWMWADAVLQPAAGRQTYTLLLQGKPVINLPPMQKRKYLKDGKFADELIPVPGVGFAMTVTASSPLTWQFGADGTGFEFREIPMEQGLPTAIDDQVEWMREAYAEGMEGHLYGWDRLQIPLTWLARFAPTRMEFKQMWERVDANKINSPDIQVEPIAYTPPVNETGAPEWAFWQKVAMDLHRRHVHWIIDNKQVWTGEFGGLWNDDSTHVENWFGYMLCLDDSRKIYDAMQRYWDGLYTYQLYEGVGKNTQDTGHYSEEGSSNLGMRLLLDYGNPEAFTRALRASSHYPKWFKEVAPGDWRFRSGWVGPMGAWEEGAFSIDAKAIGHGSDIIVSMPYLIWYNRHPTTAEFLRGLGPGGDLFGPAVERVTDWPAALKKYEEMALKPVDRTGPVDQIRAINEVGLTDAIRQVHAIEYTEPGRIAHYWGAKDTERHWFNWKVTGDDRWLVASYQRVSEWFNSHDWLNSAAMPSMDRNPLPRLSLIRSRVGAMVANRGSSGNAWPQHAISYSRGADQVAALVTENVPNRFAVRFYPFTSEPHSMQLRAWRCNGRFQVTLAHDANDDGKPEATYWQQEMELDRGAYIDLTLPPKQASILQVTPLETRPENFDRPDPAIAMETVELLYGDHLVVTVYNLGNKRLEDCVVRAIDTYTGQVVVNGEVRTGPIDAPLDFRPKYTMVEFKNINANTYGEILIQVDPERQVDDLNRYNNEVRWRYRSTFLKEGGWR